jgi:lipid A disaccharide synthetase
MANLIAGEQIVPELVQRDFTAVKAVAQLREIIPDGPARNRMLAGLDQVKARLRGAEVLSQGPALHPADRAAQMVLDLVSRSRVKANC